MKSGTWDFLNIYFELHNHNSCRPQETVGEAGIEPGTAAWQLWCQLVDLATELPHPLSGYTVQYRVSRKNPDKFRIVDFFFVAFQACDFAQLLITRVYCLWCKFNVRLLSLFIEEHYAVHEANVDSMCAGKSYLLTHEALRVICVRGKVPIFNNF
jgi:hypothetical protein